MGSMTNLPGVNPKEVIPSDPQYVSESFIEKAKNWSKKKDAGFLGRMKSNNMPPDWSVVTEFEKQIAAFFGAPYAVATDSCTHAVELCLRYINAPCITSPSRTYLSIPMLANKLGIDLLWNNWEWKGYYRVWANIFDAAVLWRERSYLPGSFMCISFQYQKHLSLGRGGMILCDNKEAAIQLKKMSYDGRLPGIPWREQDVDTHGFHYYMTPETAGSGLRKLPIAITTTPRVWHFTDWPDLTQMAVFKK